MKSYDSVGHRGPNEDNDEYYCKRIYEYLSWHTALLYKNNTRLFSYHHYYMDDWKGTKLTLHTNNGCGSLGHQSINEYSVLTQKNLHGMEWKSVSTNLGDRLSFPSLPTNEGTNEWDKMHICMAAWMNVSSRSPKSRVEKNPLSLQIFIIIMNLDCFALLCFACDLRAACVRA